MLGSAEGSTASGPQLSMLKHGAKEGYRLWPGRQPTRATGRARAAYDKGPGKASRRRWTRLAGKPWAGTERYPHHPSLRTPSDRTEPM